MDKGQSFTTCYQCKKRYVGCHATCKDYLDEVATNRKIKERKRKEEEMERLCGKRWFAK